MAIYILDVFITGFLSMFVVKELDENGIETHQSKRRKVICLGLILLTWVLIFSLRGVTGGDSSTYRNFYRDAYKLKTPFDELYDKQRDKFIPILVYVCANLFDGSWIAYCVITGLICYIPIVILIGKKSVDINTSCILYLLSLSALYGYNGLKQALACGFMMCAYYFGLRERKYVRYIFLMLIAYGFHAATLLLIPFHLLSIKKLKSISTKIIVFLLLVMTFLLDNVWSGITSIFGNDGLVSKYTNMFDNTHGSGFLRLLVWLAPLFICYFIYPNLKEKYKEIDHDILMVFFGAVFMVYSMLNVNFSQMAYFFSVPIILLYPKIINAVDIKYKKTMKYVVIILYFVYFIFLLDNGEARLSPYIPVWRSKTF